MKNDIMPAGVGTKETRTRSCPAVEATFAAFVIGHEEHPVQLLIHGGLLQTTGRAHAPPALPCPAREQRWPIAIHLFCSR